MCKHMKISIQHPKCEELISAKRKKKLKKTLCARFLNDIAVSWVGRVWKNILNSYGNHFVLYERTEFCMDICKDIFPIFLRILKVVHLEASLETTTNSLQRRHFKNYLGKNYYGLIIINSTTSSCQNRAVLHTLSSNLVSKNVYANISNFWLPWTFISSTVLAGYI